MGVWIETDLVSDDDKRRDVTPCMGVWIETSIFIVLKSSKVCHTLYGCVDWNNSHYRSVTEQ